MKETKIYDIPLSEAPIGSEVRVVDGKLVVTKLPEVEYLEPLGLWKNRETGTPFREFTDLPNWE